MSPLRPRLAQLLHGASDLPPLDLGDEVAQLLQARVLHLPNPFLPKHVNLNAYCLLKFRLTWG